MRKSAVKRWSLPTLLLIISLMVPPLLAPPQEAHAGNDATSVKGESGIVISASADRSDPKAIEHTPLKGKAFIFMKVGKNVQTVAYHIDDPEVISPPYNVASTHPFDLAGTVGSLAQAFDTTMLTNGEHTITAVLGFSNRRIILVHAHVFVDNNAATSPDPEVVAPAPGEVGAAGLHYTTAEVAVWRDRAAKGPYKSAGDASANSPGDWDRIVANKNAFLADPSTGRYTTSNLATDGNGCVEASTSQPVPSHGHSTRLRDAAFYSLVMDDAVVRDRVANELLTSTAGVPLIDFSNRTRWCLNKNWDLNPYFALASWLEKYLYARDYIGRDALTGPQNAAFDNWLYHAADTMVARRTQQFDQVWPSRYSASYTPDPCDAAAKLFDNAPATVKLPGLRANNRAIHLYEFAVPAAIYLNSHGYATTGGNPGRSLTQILEVSKQAVRDIINVAVFPFGAISDFMRGTQGAGIALHYGSAQVASITWIAEHLARAGDTSMYDYETTAGYCGTAGAPDTGESARGIHYANRTIMRYYAGIYSRTWNGVAMNGVGRIDDTRSMPLAARYYNDSELTQTYTRRRSGTAPYPSNPPGFHGQPAWTWAGQYPGVLFMFGQMEGQPSPY